MRNKVLKILTIIMVIFIIVLSFLFIFPKIKDNNHLKKENELKDKIMTEISYVDANIIEGMNKLNNINIVRYKVYSEKVNSDNNQSSQSNNDSSGNQNSQSNNGSSGNQNSQSNNGSSGNQNSQSNNGSSSNQNSQSNNGSSGNQNSQSNNGSSSNQSSQNNNSSNKPDETYSIKYNNSLIETKQNDINWNNIEYIYENIFISWQTMQIDLNEEKVNSELINRYNANLNGIANSIIQQNKESAMINYLNLYVDICDIVKYVSNDEKTQNLFYTKLYLLNAYTLCESEKWDEMYESVTNAESYFQNTYSDSDINYQSKKKISMAISNLKNTINLNEKNVFYLQYKNIMQMFYN